MLDILQKKILLASKSPRRSQLLTDAGFEIEIVRQNASEDYPSTLLPEDIAPYLAQKKARNVSRQPSSKNEVLLTADSVVIQDGKIFEKPQGVAEARKMLATLSGNQHLVVTGVCLKSMEKEVVFAGHTQVFMSRLSPEEIEFYIQQYQPFDKAGSYGVQEWIGLCKITKIEGTYSNVMGLPMDLVYEHLKEL